MVLYYRLTSNVTRTKSQNFIYNYISVIKILLLT